MDKISGILSDEESVRQLSELAKMLVSETDGGDGSQTSEDVSEETAEESSEDSGSGDGFPDIGMILKLTSLAGAFSQNDKNAELLLALRPHLGEEKQKRIDKAVKLLKIAAVWDSAKESGLLDNFMGNNN